jgi:hypothetical protein
MSEIDLDEFGQWRDEQRSPEYWLEAVIESVEDDSDMGLATEADFRLGNEAIDILERWQQAAAIGQPIPLEVKRFEEEALYTRHRFIGAEGVPGTDKIRGIQ